MASTSKGKTTIRFNFLPRLLLIYLFLSAHMKSCLIWYIFVYLSTVKIFVLVSCLFWNQNRRTYFQHVLIVSNHGLLQVAWDIVYAYQWCYSNVSVTSQEAPSVVSYLVSVLQQTQMKVDWFGFERNVLWNGVFYQWYHAVRGVVGKKNR